MRYYRIAGAVLYALAMAISVGLLAGYGQKDKPEMWRTDGIDLSPEYYAE